MNNFINRMKSFFEKKSNNTRDNHNTGSSAVTGIVRQRMQYFEELQGTNSEPTQSDTTDGFLKRCKGSYDVTESYPAKCNTDLTPAMVMNTDNVCIYTAGDDAVYGSFKKRPKFANQDSGNENEVIMRLKVREDEHLGVNRYQSMLKVPLSQQLLLSKYNDKTSSPEQESAKDVSSIIQKLNQKGGSNKQPESKIDIDLLTSICKPKPSGSSSEASRSVFQLLDGNQPLKWVDIDRVKSTNIAKRLTREEINFQESQFELIASEASYYHSLNVLVDKFYNSPLLAVKKKGDSPDNIDKIKAHQKEHLFSNILQIHSISGKFLADLEKRFSESVVMKDVCDIVTRYAKSSFKVYVPYLQNQKFQTEAYNQLKKYEGTAKIIEELESQPECCSLSLDSFLLLPMQRLLRIQLLLKAIKKNVPKGNILSADSAEIALLTLETIIDQCTENKGRMDERQRMLELASSLTAKPGTTIPTISSGVLLHEGELKCHRKTTRMKSIRVYDAWVILTNQFILITKVNRNKKISYIVEEISPIKDVVFDEASTGKENLSHTSNQFSLTFNKDGCYVMQTKNSADYAKWFKELSICPRKKPSITMSK